MKNLWFGLVLMGFAWHQGNAQVRHFNGQTGAEAVVGFSEHGQIFGVAISKYLHHRYYLKGGFNYETGEISRVNFDSYTFDISFNYTLFSINPQFFFNLVAGVGGLYEDLQINERGTDQNGYSAGVLGGVEAELFLNPHLILLVNGSQRHYLQSDFGQNRWQAAAGFKYVF